MAGAIELKALHRSRSGKGAARAVRREGRVPAVVYGGKEAPLTVSLGHAEVSKRIFAGQFLSTVITLDVDGTKLRVIPRDYQLDVVKDIPTHVDFLRITEGSRIRVEVPVHFKNQDQSPGLKAGGVINFVMHAVEVMCPPDKIPAEISIDLAGKVIGDTIHAKDIALPEGVVAVNKSNFTIASIAPPTKVETAVAAPVAEAAATPAAEAKS